MRSHIGLYVNQYSANIGDDGKSSIQFLFDHHPDTKNNNYHTPLFVDHNNTVERADFLSNAYWSSRYQNEMTGWDIGHVSTPLKEYIDQINDKSIRILIPGAGNAHEAEYLHNQGFTNVFVCDIAQEALNNLRERCPSFPQENLICRDFFQLDGHFDLILEQTFFCALSPGMRREYANRMSQLLKPGGKLVGLLFGIQFPFNGPPFGGSLEEYKTLFNDRFDINTLEPCYNSIGPRQGSELFIMFKNE